jgi:predicted dienelactone hydrolase
VIAAAFTAKPAAVAATTKPAPAAIGGVEEVRLRDPQRNKELLMHVLHPKTDGKFPVILFSHYAGGSSKEYDRLAAHWAGHGFVCLLPNHADSPAVGGQRGPQALQGWRDRAADLRFLLDSLDAIEQATPALRGRLDRNHIGVGGHYIGAHSAALLAGMKVFGPDDKAETFADPRVKAVLMLSPTGRGQGLTDQSWAGMNLPMLVMTGSKDASRRTGNDPQWRTEPFKFAPQGDKYLVFIEGLAGDYGGLIGTTPSPTSTADYVRAVTLAFWDAYLTSSDEARAYLASDKLAASSKQTLTLERK